MQRGNMIHVWIIRYSDGTLACSTEDYEGVVRTAEEHIRDTDLTYLIIE